MTDNNGVIPPWRVPEPPRPIEEAEIVQEPEGIVEVEEVTVEAPKKYRLVRGGGDPVYLLTSDNKKHWIMNPTVLQALGATFGDIERMEPSELATYLPGGAITVENVEEYKK